MPIAVGPNIEDGLYVPQTQSWLIEMPTSSGVSGASSQTYAPKTTGTAKIEGGGGVAGAPKRRNMGAIISVHDPEVIAAIFGGGEF